MFKATALCEQCSCRGRWWVAPLPFQRVSVTQSTKLPLCSWSRKLRLTNSSPALPPPARKHNKQSSSLDSLKKLSRYYSETDVDIQKQNRLTTPLPGLAPNILTLSIVQNCFLLSNSSAEGSWRKNSGKKQMIHFDQQKQ